MISVIDRSYWTETDLVRASRVMTLPRTLVACSVMSALAAAGTAGFVLGVDSAKPVGDTGNPRVSPRSAGCTSRRASASSAAWTKIVIERQQSLQTFVLSDGCEYRLGIQWRRSDGERL
jgi:hypothetical protein